MEPEKNMEQVTVEQAVELILAHTEAIMETELVDLLQASGRILAKDMVAGFDNPPFDRSPVDGYACKAEDIAGASREKPAVLTVTEEIDAGQYSVREIKPGEAVRIMTGAAIPPGCDCCIRQEDTDYGEEQVAVYRSEKVWGNYCFHGEDFKKGTVLLKKGTKLGYIEVGVIAGMGCAKVPVYRLPKVALLTSGDEVIDPGHPLPDGKIYNSNQTLMAARLMELGIVPYIIASIEDSTDKMAKALEEAAAHADLILTTGGVSVGKKDIMHDALKQIGAQRIFWRVKMKPGMPTLFTVYQGVPIVSLSGNPFGVAVTVEMLVRPLLQKMKQDDSLKLVRVKGILQEPFNKPSRGRRLIRATWKDGKIYLPDGLHSNGVLASMVGCNCLIDAVGVPALDVGTEVEAVLL